MNWPPARPDCDVAVDPGKDDEIVRPDHLGDLGRQPVVVADTDFLGGDGVVLVDDRHHVRFEQAMHRIARVEEAPVVFEIAERQQHLRDIEAEFVPHLLVGVEQQGHAAGGRRLLVETLRFRAFHR